MHKTISAGNAGASIVAHGGSRGFKRTFPALPRWAMVQALIPSASALDFVEALSSRAVLPRPLFNTLFTNIIYVLLEGVVIDLANNLFGSRHNFVSGIGLDQE